MTDGEGAGGGQLAKDLRRDLKEILRIDALDCAGATTDALLVRAAVDAMATLHTTHSRADEYLDEAQRAGARLAELEAEADILRQYAITGATFAGMCDEIALPVGSWPHVGEFAARLAGVVTMHRRMSGEHEQEAPNHLDTDGRDASRDPKPGDVWVIDGRPWIVKLPGPRFLPAPNVRPEIELENCDSRRVGKSILRTVWPLFVAPHTFIRNLNELTQPPIDKHDPELPSLAQVG